MNKKTANIIRFSIIALCIVLIIVLIWTMLGGAKPKELSYEGEESLVQMIKDNKVAGIYINGGYTAYVLAEGSTTTKDAFFKNPTKKATYFVRIPSRTEFAGKLDGLVEAGANVPVVKYDDPNSGSTWTSLLFPIGSLILMGIVVFFLFRQAGGANKQAMNFGKTKARLNMNVNVKFSDVAGAEEEKLELAEIVEFLKNPQKFTALGARIPKGVLLVGPPGTGKTLFAKAVAGESNVPFFSISGSDFVEMFVGTGAARVRDLFDQAKRNMPCIIFIDEIDAVGRHRGAGLGGGNDEREQTLNQLLVQMDGFEKNDGIIIMAATNRVDILDPALMRPGRFDRQIYVNTPDVKGREAIFKVHARNKPLASEISFKVLARMTSGFSGADIENLLNEASILAARADRKVIIMEDILEAINKVIAGPQKKSRIITDSDKRITAYHEAGHAIIAKVLPHCDEVQEVSIIPRGMAAGYTLTRPESDDSHVSKNKLTDLITMMLGGRAAEEIVIHDVSTGASNDIQRATSIARSMVTEWGMSDKVGNIFLGGEKEVFLGKDYATQHTYSEKIGDLIDSEIKKIIDDCYARAIEVLKSKRDILDNMVKVLYEKETIYTSEVEMLFEGKSAEEVVSSIDARQEKNDKYKKTSAPKVEIVPETSKPQEKPTEDKIEDEAEDKEQLTPTDEPKDND
ncbi:MAG: ATP-dependent zinc metalloprotease FtsH [Clostridia bacterium]|nr:ATP-dependent zinc metalloprotease FtsH [Clostridia bacterium]MDY4082707.1 ATP-dependent zinc metalloprotease FtsH [Eubacteriales bacterium]